MKITALNKNLSHPQGITQCDHCPKRFVFKKSLILHMLRHVKLSNSQIISHNKCEHCTKQFLFKISLIKHRCSTLPNQDEEMQCNYCGKMFKSQTNLDMHMTDHHRFTCSGCAKVFTTEETLHRFRTKTDLGIEDEYFCKVCSHKIQLGDENETKLENPLNRHQCTKSLYAETNFVKHIRDSQ